MSNKDKRAKIKYQKEKCKQIKEFNNFFNQYKLSQKIGEIKLNKKILH